MKLFPKLTLATFAVASLAACMTINVAPGADKVRITQAAADVQSCQAVGNIDGRKTGGTPILLGNAVIGDGGDTLLMTVPGAGLGIAYKCAKD